jgi:hypothetical protein
MENYNEKKKDVKNDLIDVDANNTDDNRRKENFEKSSSSNITTEKFNQDHGRTNNSLGDGHEPGTTPGAGI